MQASPRDANASPGIKCSSCGQDIDMATMSEHVCGTSTPGNLPPPFPVRARDADFSSGISSSISPANRFISKLGQAESNKTSVTED